MKSSKLIRLIQEIDPSGEMEITVGNTDILFVESSPSYWDGCQEILIRDESSSCYNVVGAKYRVNGYKLIINTLSIEEAILEDINIPVDFSELDNYNSERKNEYENRVQKWREEIDNMKRSIEKKHFVKYVRNKLNILNMEDNEQVIQKAVEFFDNNISWKDEIPKHLNQWIERKEGGKYLPSFNERREKQWDEQYCDWLNALKDTLSLL